MWQVFHNRSIGMLLDYRNHTPNQPPMITKILNSKLTLVALLVIGLGMIANTDAAKWLFKAIKGGDTFEVVNISKKEKDRYPILNETNAFRARNVHTGHLVFFAGYEEKLQPGTKFKIRWGQLSKL